MNPGDTWTVMVNAGQAGGRIWARTGCTSTGPNGLTCTTGDCGGVLQCTGYGKPPNTLAEYTLNGFSNLDYFDISLVDGFNVPLSFLPTNNGCTVGPTCSADLNANCPAELKTDQGCNNPCTGNPNCGPTDLTRYFKNLCPTAYSYSKDDATSTFTCPGGTDYMGKSAVLKGFTFVMYVYDE
ncbi:hypothetical protein Cgig2_030859 [Carnegiea gigantea]|uniref:Thaumatin-like protein n=1 Tax=Carnegiea gigantea TaxID=171969 RepID=A0A9Q1KHT2_9CARY|nr:hypothetical protein Cgig2_030859 [Carnegiea gigantea]